MLSVFIQWIRRLPARYKVIRSKAGQLEQITPLVQAIRQVWDAVSAEDKSRLLQEVDPRLRLMSRLEIHSPQELENMVRLLSTSIKEDMQAERLGPPLNMMRAIYIAEAQRLIQYEWRACSPALDQALLNLQQVLDQLRESRAENSRGDVGT